MSEQQPVVKGLQVDKQTRCAHYHSEVDIIAIKFHCCQQYYACYFCHQHEADHPVTRWPQIQWNEKVILCGNCYHEWSVHTYMNVNSCPHCHHSFNDKCSNHYHLYFDVEGEGPGEK